MKRILFAISMVLLLLNTVIAYPLSFISCLLVERKVLSIKRFNRLICYSSICAKESKTLDQITKMTLLAKMFSR